MGGSGGGTFNNYEPKTLQKEIRKSESVVDNANFDTQLSARLADCLSNFNDKDTDLISQRINDAAESIDDALEGKLDSLYGGSVAKHTYVDGLSDIDTLFVFSNTELSDKSPSDLLDYAVSKLRDKLDATVEKGSISVTVSYEDGMSIQILPALMSGDQLKVSSWDGKSWSNINPSKFNEALTKRNKECSGKLIPMIKLAKAINSNMPEPAQLTGYHIESIAISAFKEYAGTKSITKMLPHYFEKAKELVKTPIKDSSGQSVHVDDYMGDSNSDKRTKASHILDRISKRMKNATGANSIEQWMALIDNSE